ncbi:hypothetical protein UlMin_003727 [Ulmus minor]
MTVPVAKVILSFFLFLLRVLAVPKECREERCGGFGPIIKFPFRLKDRQPVSCGYPGFDLSCTSDNQLLLDLPLPFKIHVYNIDYVSQEIELYADGYYKDVNCSSLPKQLSQFLNLSLYPFQHSRQNTSILNCSSSSIERDNFFGPIPCLSVNNYSIYMIPSFSLVKYSNEFVSCTKIKDVTTNISQLIIGSSIMSWYKPDCSHCEAKGKSCRLKKPHEAEHETVCVQTSKSRKGSWSERSVKEGATIGSVVVLLLAVILCIFYLYNSNKNDREHRLRVEKFLADYMAMKPSRYTYAEIKKITNEFQEKLGEGAYGTVFKGKISIDILVAVKILNHFDGNGEDFVNEVRTMGGIHHVNVVRLVGYCADGFRRALVYEFLPNNSLERYVSSTSGGTNHLLSWETLQKIALGIAKGMEYLHQGCDQRILHFDIKPHNILLDHNFAPKISDFGLAKLCSKDKSIVSMTTVRGTMGYIAPEVFSRNFGNVSYKSDVYSFGMLVLEMVGGRKRDNVMEENVDEIYYPKWIYNMLKQGEDLRIQIEEEADAEIAKKLAIVGLWCIQWHPAGRPTMKVAVQMLEGREELTMPPNPFASTTPSTANIKKVARRIALELEAISE